MFGHYHLPSTWTPFEKRNCFYPGKLTNVPKLFCIKWQYTRSFFPYMSFYHSTFLQIFALSVEKKSNDMKKQKRKQEKLVLKMLPKAIVQRVMSGETAAETFDQATLYFSSVDGFVNVSTKCK